MHLLTVLYYTIVLLHSAILQCVTWAMDITGISGTHVLKTINNSFNFSYYWVTSFWISGFPLNSGNIQSIFQRQKYDVSYRHL